MHLDKRPGPSGPCHQWSQWSPVVTSGHQCSPVVTLFCCQAAGISEQDPQREVLGLDFALLGGSFCSSAIAKNGCLFQERRNLRPTTYTQTNTYKKNRNVSCIEQSINLKAAPFHVVSQITSPSWGSRPRRMTTVSDRPHASAAQIPRNSPFFHRTSAVRSDLWSSPNRGTNCSNFFAASRTLRRMNPSCCPSCPPRWGPSWWGSKGHASLMA